MLSRKTPLRRTPMKRTGFSPLKRTPIPRMSAKRRVESREYNKLKKAFLEANPWCQLYEALREAGDGNLMRKIWPHTTMVLPRSVDVHHKRRRHSGGYLDVTSWMAVSREGHDYIESHPSESRQKGWLV